MKLIKKLIRRIMLLLLTCMLWANVGFTNQILDDIRNNSHEDIDCETILKNLMNILMN